VSTCAIIVLYEPQIVQLKINLEHLRSQVESIILVDNSKSSSYESLKFLLEDRVVYLFLGENLGIAKAQNIGIAHAKELKFEFVLLLDQDSVPKSNLVECLLSDYYQVIENGIPLAVIGSSAINSFNNKPYKPRFRNFKAFDFNDNILVTSQVISSGSLLSIDNFYFVGEFKEELFIDGVDHEWCWRASSKGMLCAISNSAVIHHSLGEGDRNFIGFRISISSIFRIYFQYRNYVYLCKFRYVPTYWKIVNFLKYLIKIFYYPIVLSPRYLPRMIKGIFDGFKM
jgi:rhamnosyltransferase